MDAGSLIAFTGVAALLTVTPGADMAVVTRTALGDGRRAALLTAAGVNVGLLFWGTASALGISALLASSASAFTTLKLVGAAYLLWLGVTTLRQAVRGVAARAAPLGGSGAATAGDAAAFRRGLLTNVLNPKVGVFYSTLLPQFMGPDDPVLALSLVLTLIHVVMGLTWLAGYAWLVARSRDLFARPRVRRALDALTGTVLVGFGLRLARAR